MLSNCFIVTLLKKKGIYLLKILYKNQKKLLNCHIKETNLHLCQLFKSIYDKQLL